MPTATADSTATAEQLASGLFANGGIAVLGEFLFLAEKKWTGQDNKERTDYMVNVRVGARVAEVRYRSEADVIEALGGSVPFAGTRVALPVYVRAPAKDFVAYDGIVSRS